MIRSFALTALLAVAPIAATPALADVTVGAPDSGNCYPFSCNDGGDFDFYQTYSASAFSGVTSFDTISFAVYPGLPGTILAGNYDISFGTTSAGLLSNPAGSLANVASFYNGSLAPTQYSITGNAYTYDPSTGDLVLHIVTTGQPPVNNGSGNGYLLADYTGTQVRRSYTNTAAAAAVGVTGALVTTFGTAAPEPATWAMMVTGFGIVGFALRGNRRRTAHTA